MASKPLGKIVPSETALFVCDVQERFRQVRAADALHMPVLVTEQYPQKLGATVAEINEVIPESLLIGGQRFAKTTFSMMVPEVSDALRRHPHIRKVLLCGIETHVCVLQTALDLLEGGYEVHVLVDGVSSQRFSDRAVALQRLAQSGAFLATSEMALFQLMVGTQHPAFRTVSGLCKEERPAALPEAKL